jgi:hypothetical protein
MTQHLFRQPITQCAACSAATFAQVDPTMDTRHDSSESSRDQCAVMQQGDTLIRRSAKPARPVVHTLQLDRVGHASLATKTAGMQHSK